MAKIALLLFVVGLLYGATIIPIDAALNALAAWVQQHVLAGAAVFVCFVVLGTVIFVPGSIIMMMGGLIFGFVTGSILLLIAIPVAAQCAFFISRAFGHAWLRKKIESQPRLVAIDAALGQRASTVIILTRLSLVLPFNLLNYVYGATRVSATQHIFATAVGMLLPIFLYAYLGSIARDVAAIVSGEATPSGLGFWIGGIGFTAIVVMTWILHRATNQALSEKLSTPDGGEG